MKISFLQQDLAWEDKPENFSRFEAMIFSDISCPDIYIMPEMFNTGFSVNPAPVSEPPASGTFRWMKETSARKGSAICGSYIVQEDNCYYNRFIFVSPEGESYHYNKRHLFSMGGEDKAFTPGTSRTIFSYKGVRILPLVCYDLRFPVWARNRNEYDLLIYSANWPVARRDVWMTLLKARALENQCYVAGANRIGTDATGADYFGGSMIITARGEVISSGNDNSSCIVSAGLSMEELTAFRAKFPVLKDADRFSFDL